MYASNFLDGFDRLVAVDAETTGKKTPSAEFIRKQPFAWKPPGIVIEVGFVEMLRDGEGWRKGESWGERVNPDAPIDPQAIQIHKIKPADLKHAPRFPALLARVQAFIGDSPIVAHAYENERDFLDYEFARAKAIMTERRIRHVPVVHEDQLVGMISIGDVVKARFEQLESEKKDLLDYVSSW